MEVTLCGLTLPFLVTLSHDEVPIRVIAGSIHDCAARIADNLIVGVEDEENTSLAQAERTACPLYIQLQTPSRELFSARGSSDWSKAVVQFLRQVLLPLLVQIVVPQSTLSGISFVIIHPTTAPPRFGYRLEGGDLFVCLLIATSMRKTKRY